MAYAYMIHHTTYCRCLPVTMVIALRKIQFWKKMYYMIVLSHTFLQMSVSSNVWPESPQEAFTTRFLHPYWARKA